MHYDGHAGNMPFKQLYLFAFVKPDTSVLCKETDSGTREP